MAPQKQTTLARMQAGQSGKVISIDKGHGIVRRLEAMGIRPGQRITKISAMFMRGPVTVQVKNTRIALGHGMASKIIVEPEDK